MGIGKNSSLESIICQESESLIEELSKSAKESMGSRLSMRQRFMPAANNVIWRIVNGRLTTQSDPEVVKLTDDVTAVMTKFDPGSLSNLLQQCYWWIPRVYHWLGIVDNLSNVGKPLLASLEKNIQDGRPDNQGTFIDRHLARLEMNKSNPGSAFCGEKGMSNLKGCLLDLFLAGKGEWLKLRSHVAWRGDKNRVKPQWVFFCSKSQNFLGFIQWGEKYRGLLISGRKTDQFYPEG